MPQQIQILYPNSMELRLIDQLKLPFLLDDPVLKELFPMREVNTHLVEWEQQDNFNGMMAPRGLDGAPPRINAKGFNRFSMEPGVYGEHAIISERDITTRVAYGQVNGPVDVRDLTLNRSEFLIHRMTARQLWVCWQLLLNGRFTVLGANGAVAHQDAYSQTVYVPLVLWSSTATATPLQDMRNMQLLSRGTSNKFDSTSKIWMNRRTFNYVTANTNPADIYGKRTDGLANVMSLEQVNMVLTKEDLPNIRIYDETYPDEAGTTQLFIGEGQGCLVGSRPNGAPLGELVLTRNAWDPGYAPGVYYKLIEGQKPGEPPLEIHRGFNGGITLHYPSAIVSLKVA